MTATAAAVLHLLATARRSMTATEAADRLPHVERVAVRFALVELAKSGAVIACRNGSVRKYIAR